MAKKVKKTKDKSVYKLTREEYKAETAQKRIKLSYKAEAQYKKLSKKIKITRREFKDFYDNIRKANRKAQRLEKRVEKGDESATALRNIEFSTGLKTVERISTREDFLRYRKAVNKVLKRNWRTSENLRQRERTNKYLEEIFGNTPRTEAIEDYLNQLSNSDYNDFWESNKELKKIRWGSPQKAKKAAKLLKETSDRFEERIKAYEAKKANISLEELEEYIDKAEKDPNNEIIAVELTDLREVIKKYRR